MRRLGLLKKILERKLLMSFLIQRYEKYDKYIGRLSYFLGTISGTLAAINNFAPDGVISVANIVSSAITLACFKVRESLAYAKIIINAKESVVKYQELYEKIMASLSDEDFDPFNKEFAQIKDFEPIVDHSIVFEYQEYCRKEKITTSIDEAAQIHEITELQNILIHSDGKIQPRKTIDEFLSGVRVGKQPIEEKKEPEAEPRNSKTRREFDIMYASLSPRSTRKSDSDRMKKLISFNGTF